MTLPDDRELEQYLEGGSKLSRRYRDASSEGAPPELDEAILANARAELRRKPDLNRWLASVALAASLVLGVNLAWNVYESAPRPGDASPVLAEKSRDDAFVPEPPPAAAEPAPQPQRNARAATPAAPPERETALDTIEVTGSRVQEDAGQAKAEAREETEASDRQAETQRRSMQARDAAGAAAPAAALAPPSLADAAPMSEAVKIDHLIDHIRTLEGAVFIRNGKEYGPAEAAKHMQLKRDKAGARCDTADEFIRTCASFSSMSGDAYMIRFADGRTRTAEDVLREELSRIQAR